MVTAKLPNLLVLRRDTATGFYAVGWDSEMPIGRFTHIELICQTASSETITPQHATYATYMAACHKAREFNAPLLEEQIRQALVKGWLSVPLDLQQALSAYKPDLFGCLQVCAQQARYRLCRNHPYVWCVLADGVVVNVRASTPPRVMEAVEFHVWEHQQQRQMQQIGDEILEGQLIALESGLWFSPNSH